jgi:hypothetical protein
MEPSAKKRTLRDIGYGEPATPELSAAPDASTGAFPEELAAARKYAQEQGASNQSWSDWAGDVGSNIKNVATGFLPTSLGGRGDIGVSDIVSGAAQVGKEGFMFPGRAMRGEVKLFDEAGRPTEEGIKGSQAFTSLATIPAGVKPLTGLPEKAATRRIREAVRSDIETGGARGLDPNVRSNLKPQPLPGGSPEELGMLSNEGIFTSAYDLSGGPATKRLLEGAAAKTEEARSTAKNLQERQTERAVNSGAAVGETIDRIAGRPLAIGDEMIAARKAIKDTNDPNYTAVMSIPENGGLMSISLQRVMESRPVFMDIIKDVNKTWANSGRMPPQILDAKGKFAFNPSNMPPLEYLDQIYRKLRDETNNAYKAGNTTDANGLKSARDAFRNELDNLAAKLPDGRSSYKMIRDEASDVFGGKDALEAGYNYLAVSSGLKASEISNALRAYSPDQLQRFKEGVLSKIKEDALKPSGTNSGFNKLVSYFDGSNQAMSDRLYEALGDTDYIRLSNQVNMQNIVNKSKALKIKEEEIPAGSKGIGAATGALLGAGGAYFMENAPALSQIFSPSNITPGTIAAVLGAGIAGSGAGLYKIAGMFQNKFERAVATRIAEALSSQDPAAIAALNRIPPKTLNKYLTRFSYALEGAGVPSREVLKASVLDGRQPPPLEDKTKPKKRTVGDVLSRGAKNSGGRVARKSGGRIKSNPISAEVRQVRTLLSEKTASMLSMPDDAIATALNIAKGNA